MAKLSDTAETILSTAASRDTHRVLPLPKLKAPPVIVQKTLKSLLADGFIEEVPASPDDEVWEHSEVTGRRTLIVTKAGLSAIGIEDDAATPPKRRHKADKSHTLGRSAGRGAKVAKKASRARTGDGVPKTTKQSVVIGMLRRREGASLEEMMAATDWQAHSVRGFMSGALKKRLGMAVVSEKDRKTGERRYFVVAAPN